jgi:rhodanese-related sulfurtransferase
MTDVPTVTAIAPASPQAAYAFFASRLSFETDCADVHHDLYRTDRAFVLLDARSERAYGDGHVPTAQSFPHTRIAADSVRHLPRDVTLVTYCWGPHCNGATRAAMKLAALGFSVKEMAGGYDGWRHEGYPIERNTNDWNVTRS